jgi:NADP-dependent 3-hydroxy acid dehydrogenase YdfG
MEGITEKVVVITGASSGIGEATAVMLAERGAKVVLGARGWIGLRRSLAVWRERAAR